MYVSRQLVPIYAGQISASLELFQLQLDVVFDLEIGRAHFLLLGLLSK